MRLRSRLDINNTLWVSLSSHHPQMGQPSWMKTSSGLPLILHYGQLYTYFIIYHNVVIIEIKCTINVMCLNHPETILPNRSMGKLSSMKLVPKRLGTPAVLYSAVMSPQAPLLSSVTVSQTFLILMTLKVLKSNGHVFYSMSLNSDLFVFLMVGLGLWIFRRKTKEVTFHPHHIISIDITSHC